jgi:hypothetical protein
MPLRVPEQQIVQIRKFLELPDDKIQGFLDALANAGPQFNVFDLAREISGSLQLPADLTLGIIRVLVSVYLTRDLQQPIDRFIDGEVYPALKRANAFSGENIDAQWKKLRSFLIPALGLDRSVGTAAKAGSVLTHHERIFAGARIMTDIRPIFHLNVSDRPDAAMIVHMLRITQRDNRGERADLFFALDSNDIALMKDLLDRALKKENTIKSVMKDAGVAVLDPKLIY